MKRARHAPSQPSPSSKPAGRPFLVATIACALVAIGLRAWRLGHGLPDLTEEAFPFRHALALWGSAARPADLNPHWFAYPSLTVYLHYFVQQVFFVLGRFPSPDDFLLRVAIDPSALVVAARTLAVLADAATVVLAGRIAIRFGLAPAIVAMSLVALAPTMIATARLLYADSIMTALAVAALERLLAWLELGGARRLVTAAALVGLGAGAKYPAAMLIVPLLVAIVLRERSPRALATSARALAVAALAFVLTTPFVLVSWNEFVRDLTYMGDTTTRGGLGILSGTGARYAFSLLARNLGVAGGVALVASAWSLWRGPARGAVAVLALAWVAFFVPVALVPVEAERYLVASVALGACLAAIGMAPLLAFARQRAGPVAVAALGVAFALQPAWNGFAAATRGRSTTQLEARRWCEANLRESDVVLSEAYGPMLRSHRDRAEMVASPLFRAASPESRQRYLAQPAHRMVVLPLLIGGYASIPLPPGSSHAVDVYPHAVDWNAAVYELRLLRGVDVVITTGAVRGRFATDPGRFPDQARFYTFLDRTAEKVAELRPGRGLDGPVVTIHRLTARAREAVENASELERLWWARTVPEEFQWLADSVFTVSPPPGLLPGVPLWVQALRPSYDMRYREFALDLAENAAAVGRLAAARELVLADLAVAPEDLRAAKVFVEIARRQGTWSDVVPRLERTMRVLLRGGAIPPELQLDYAEALLRTGDRARAERLLEQIAATTPSLAGAARALKESR